MTSGWRSTSCGVPSAIFLPKFSTVILSDTFSTSPMSWSIRKIVRPWPRKPLEQRDQLLLLGLIQAGTGLVQQQQLGMSRQRACNLDQALMAVRQIADDHVARDPRCRRTRSADMARVANASSPGCDRVAVALGADHHVLQRRHASGTGGCSGTCGPCPGRRACAASSA